MRRLLLLGVNACVAVCRERERERDSLCWVLVREHVPQKLIEVIVLWYIVIVLVDIVVVAFALLRFLCLSISVYLLRKQKQEEQLAKQSGTTWKKGKKSERRCGDWARYGEGWVRKNNINSSRNYELQLFSCLGHFSSSFLSRCDAQVLPTWLKAETAKHTHTHSLFLSLFFFSFLFLSPRRAPKKQSVAKEQKELANF